jgi:hypothetical protein
MLESETAYAHKLRGKLRSFLYDVPHWIFFEQHTKKFTQAFYNLACFSSLESWKCSCLFTKYVVVLNLIEH